jgi:Na+:H+ antiporter, NhaA family
VGALASPVTLGVVLGLVVGKQLGITLFAWLAVRSGVSELPEGIGWRHVYGVGWLAGIGFTMSLFISDLAFSEDSLVETAKLGILGASLIAGVVGWTILRGAFRPR